MTSLTPEPLALARTRIAMSEPTVESEIMQSGARPCPLYTPEAQRRWKALAGGQHRQTERCRAIASVLSTPQGAAAALITDAVGPTFYSPPRM
jgi:hypothetical protein